MKRGLTLFLQTVVVLIGLGALAVMLWFPHIEGRNAHATAFEVYFNDPFLAYAYVASAAFFVALHQAFKVLGFAGRNQVFSPAAVKALRTIQRCAIAIIGFVAVAVIIILRAEGEDAAGGVFLGVVITLGSVVTATAAAMFERILRNGQSRRGSNANGTASPTLILPKS